jgi:hypothetical protein
MAKIRLTSKAQQLISRSVDQLFEKAKARFLGMDQARKLGGKHISFSFTPELTLQGLFDAAAHEEGVKPNDELLQGLLKIAGSYLDAQKERAKAKVLQSTQAFLSDASAKGVATNVRTVLGGQLADLWGDVNKDVRKILETETTVVRNVSIHDAISRIGVATQQEDPTVFFVTVRDKHKCDECTRLHVMPDEVTPRTWKQSQLGSGYHKKGENTPKVGGLHPHCRCVLTLLMPGYGFSESGHVQYKSPGYDEYAAQHKS